MNLVHEFGPQTFVVFSSLLSFLHFLSSHNQSQNRERRFLLTMDSNWRPSGGDPTAAGGGPAAEPIANPDWRTQLQPEARPRIVTKITDTLKRHLPVLVPEGLNEVQKIAVRFEERIYSTATSQSDYLRRISLKMLSMETKAQGLQINPAPNPNPQNLHNPNPQNLQNPNPQNLQNPNLDWRLQFQPEARQRVVNKIINMSKRHLLVPVQEVTEFAVRFEEKLYSVATSQADYLRKISLKMLLMETKASRDRTELDTSELSEAPSVSEDSSYTCY